MNIVRYHPWFTNKDMRLEKVKHLPLKSQQADGRIGIPCQMCMIQNLNIRVIHAEVKTYLKHKHGLPLINHDQDTSVNVIKRGTNKERIHLFQNTTDFIF